jgi:hypothetical protein
VIRRHWLGAALAAWLALGCSDALSTDRSSVNGAWRFTQALDPSVTLTLDLILDQYGDSVAGWAHHTSIGTSVVYGRAIGDSVALTLQAIDSPPPCPGGMHVYARLTPAGLRGSFVVCDNPTPALFTRRDVRDAAVNGVWKLVRFNNEAPGPQASHGVIADTLELHADGRLRVSVQTTSFGFLTWGTYERVLDSVRVQLFPVGGPDSPTRISRYSLRLVGDSLIREVALSGGGVTRWAYRR